MTERWSDLPDEELGRRLAAELPRYAAPAYLRTAVRRAASRRTRPTWFAPTVSALATAALFVLVALPTLPARTPQDITQQLVDAVVAEHSRASMWGARTTETVPTDVVRVAEETGIRLVKTFLGDDDLEFLGAEPVYLDWRLGIALHYLDPEGHAVTYVALHAPRLLLPERERVQVDRFRPALVKLDGFGSWVWKQGEVACFLVSDIVGEPDLERFKDYFIRVRAGTEPSLVY